MATTILTGAQVSPSGEPGPLGGGTLPIGAIIDFAGAVEPAGWLFCFGQAVPRVGIYTDLFNQISTYWGAGDGSTTFNVPDLRGFILAGRDDMGGVNANRLSSMGGEAIRLAGNGGDETHILSVAQIPNHTHAYQSVAFVAGSYAPLGTGWYPNQPSTPTSGAGGGQAHNNIQPTTIVNKIIKYASVNLGPITPGTGDVVGPAGCLDGEMAIFQGNTGKLLRSQPLASVVPVGGVVQVSTTEYDVYRTSASIIPADDTPPLIGEGAQLFAVNFTPKFANSRIKIDFNGSFYSGAGLYSLAALFRDSVALQAKINGPGVYGSIDLPCYDVAPGSLAQITYQVRFGPNAAGNVYVNGNPTVRNFGGVQKCVMTIQEIKQ